MKPYRKRLNIAVDSGSESLLFFSKDNLYLATGYTRVVIGKRGPYVEPKLVSDPRYRSQVNKIKTLVFAITKWSGTPTPSDDLSGGELAWFSLKQINPELLVPNHLILMKMIQAWHELKKIS